MTESESQAKENQEEALKDAPEREEEPASQDSQGSETTKEIVDKVANLGKTPFPRELVENDFRSGRKPKERSRTTEKARSSLRRRIARENEEVVFSLRTARHAKETRPTERTSIAFGIRDQA